MGLAGETVQQTVWVQQANWLGLAQFAKFGSVKAWDTQMPQTLFSNSFIFCTSPAISTLSHLVGGLEHFLFFHSVGNNKPIWLSYFSALKWNHQLVIIIPIFDDSIPTFPAKRDPCDLADLRAALSAPCRKWKSPARPKLPCRGKRPKGPWRTLETTPEAPWTHGFCVGENPWWRLGIFHDLLLK